MNTLQRLNKIEKQRSKQYISNAEFVRTSPIITLRKAVLEYASIEQVELRTALRDKIAANLSSLFNSTFQTEADAIDILNEKKEQI